MICLLVLKDQSKHKKAQSYWTTLKNRLKKEGSEVVTKCDQLKMMSSDGGKLTRPYDRSGTHLCCFGWTFHSPNCIDYLFGLDA